jgi:hypothetical protein
MKGNTHMTKKRIVLFVILLTFTIGLVSCTSSDDALDSGSEDEQQQTVEGYLASFVLDEHVTVTIYDTQDYTDGTEALSAYAKDSDTGEVLTDGEGQINFTIDIDEGYELDTLIVTPSSNYKNLKDPEELELDNTYRITKVEDDITITITTKEEGTVSEVTEFTATFILDDNVTVTVYDTSELLNGTVTTTAYAKDSDTGEILTDGDGQVNFVVTLADGYVVDTVTVESEDSFKNLKDPEELELVNTYRITKITSDITITITTKAVD